MYDYVGWFAEQVPDDDPDFNACWPYRATLQLPGFVVTTQGPWFATEAECLDFIRDDVVGKGLYPDGANAGRSKQVVTVNLEGSVLSEPALRHVVETEMRRIRR